MQNSVNGGLTAGSGVDTSDLTAHTKRNGEVAPEYKSDSANEWYYKKQEAEMNHRYALDAWNRENEYNLPENVAKRLRDAGINPRVAFGNGSGTGGTIEAGKASGNYGKSDATQAAERTEAYGGLAVDAMNSGMELANTIGSLQGIAAEVKYKNAQTKGLQIDNLYKESHHLRDLEQKSADIRKTNQDTKTSGAQERKHEGDIRYINQQIEESKQNIRESQQDIRESNSRMRVNDQSIAESQERVRLLEVQRELNRSQKFNVEMDTALKEAQKGHYGKLMQQIDKEIEYIGHKMGYDKQRIAQIQQQITIDQARQAVQKGATISSEIRNWVFGWIPFVNAGSSSSSGGYSGYDSSWTW